jgi:hypothetical protein
MYSLLPSRDKFPTPLSFSWNGPANIWWTVKIIFSLWSYLRSAITPALLIPDIFLSILSPIHIKRQGNYFYIFPHFYFEITKVISKDRSPNGSKYPLVLICYLFSHPFVLSLVLSKVRSFGLGHAILSCSIRYYRSSLPATDSQQMRRGYKTAGHTPSRCTALWPFPVLFSSSRSYDVAVRKLVVGSDNSGQYICPICNERPPKFLFAYRRFGTKYQRNIQGSLRFER